MGKSAKKVAVQKNSPRNSAEDYKNIMSKNQALTQALCESNECYQSILSERNKLQRENLELILKNRELNNRLVKINTWSRSLLDMTIKGSELTTNIIYQSHAENDSEASHSSDLSQNYSNNNTSTKTQAVKPMVSGHVIHRPIINLPRVPTEELVRLGSSSYHSAISRAEVATTTPVSVISTFVPETDAGEGTSSSSPDILRRLSPIHEEATPSPRSSNKSVTTTPLLSGIFNDVRVYLSPMDRVFPIQVNNKLIPATSTLNVTTRMKKKRASTTDLSSANILPATRIKVDHGEEEESNVVHSSDLTGTLENPPTRVTRRSARMETKTAESSLPTANSPTKNPRTRRSARYTHSH